jgi:triosephosphate isomerase
LKPLHAGVLQVLIGHSEQRSTCGESDEDVNEQMIKALEGDFKPLLCIGDTKGERETGLNTMVCALQLSKALKGVTKQQMMQVTIAYEPRWALSSGQVCDPDTAQEIHSFIRYMHSVGDC